MRPDLSLWKELDEHCSNIRRVLDENPNVTMGELYRAICKKEYLEDHKFQILVWSVRTFLGMSPSGIEDEERLNLVFDLVCKLAPKRRKPEQMPTEDELKRQVIERLPWVSDLIFAQAVSRAASQKKISIQSESACTGLGWYYIHREDHLELSHLLKRFPKLSPTKVREIFDGIVAPVSRTDLGWNCLFQRDEEGKPISIEVITHGNQRLQL